MVSKMRPNETLLIYSAVETIGFNPCPDEAFISIAPFEEIVRVAIPVSDFSEGNFASVVYTLRVLRIGEEHDNRQDLIAALRRPWPCDVQSVDVARVDGLDDLPSGLDVLRFDCLDDLRHGAVRKVPIRAEKEVEDLPIGVEKGGAVFVDEIAVCGDAVRSFLFGERLWRLVFAMVEGKGGGEDVGLVECGTFGMPLAVLVEEEKQFGFAPEEFAAPFPRRDVANRVDDVVVGSHKCGEDKTAILIFP